MSNVTANFGMLLDFIVFLGIFIHYIIEIDDQNFKINSRYSEILSLYEDQSYMIYKKKSGILLKT